MSSSNLLSQRFFSLIKKISKSNFDYSVYKFLYPHSTLVLRSNISHTPLIALTLQFENSSGVISPCVVTQRDPPKSTELVEKWIQGMVSTPNQYLKFVVTNLSTGWVNFNVLFKRHHVNQTNPGPEVSINQVNEFKPLETYEIQVDQRTGKKMILAGLEENIEGENTAVTVSETESKNHSSSGKGVYFYLCGLPEQGGENEKFFQEGTEWICDSHVVIKHPIVKSQPKIPFHTFRRSWGIEHGRESGVHALNSNSSPIEKGMINEHFSDLNFNFGSNSSTKKGFITLDEEEHEEISTSPIYDIQQSQAGSLKYGDDFQVQSVVTGKEYNCELTSPPTVLCLSISPSIVYLHPPKDDHIIETLAQFTLEEYLNNEGKQLLNTLKVYPSEWCVITMDEYPDVISVQCGHKCMKWENVKSYVESLKNRNVPHICPLCRQPVVAFIREDGVMY